MMMAIMFVAVMIILGMRGMVLEGMALQKRASYVITSRPAQHSFSLNILPIVIVFIIPIISYISYHHYQLQASEKRATEDRYTYLPS